MGSVVVRGHRIILPGGVCPASLHVRDGVIARIGSYDDPAAIDGESIDAGDLVVMPGLVDTHVHINDPGRADWEGFETATRAAAAAGITTLMDMPLNSIPATTTVAGLDAKRRAAVGRCFVDVGFWGGVVPGNSAELEPLARKGVRGFKCFLSPSGVDEFPHVTEADLRLAMPILDRLHMPLLVHAELPARLREATGDPRAYATWLASRPVEAETAAIEMLARLSREFGTLVHIVHVASSDAVEAINRARAAGVPITSETCPHYLTFAAEEVAEGATLLKCAPPIRQQYEREALWRALQEGRIDLVATDHSPAPPAMKCVEEGDFIRAWGGIASLQIGFAATWTGARRRGIPLATVVGWMASAPARLAGFAVGKGVIAERADADLVIFDPEAEMVVDFAALHHRHPLTPYHGMTLHGVVKRTLLRGDTIYENGRVLPTPRGKVIASR